MTRDDLIGTWALQSYALEATDGSRLEPYGPSPLGSIIYADDGGMAAHMMAPDRMPIDRDTALVDPEAARQLVTTYLSYCGRWRLEGGEVVHTVTAALLPEWVGTELRRTVVLAGDLLTLSVEKASIAGKAGRAVLVWHRSKSTGARA